VNPRAFDPPELFGSTMPHARQKKLDLGRDLPEGARFDKDGLLIPDSPIYWQVDRWEKQPITFRRARSNEYRERLQIVAPERARRTYQANYSTAYCKDLCRERGWRIIQSEYRDHRGNLRDTPFGSDVVAMDGNRLIYIQGGCKGSRAEHHRRFMERTDVLPLGARFLYWEFLREGDLILEEEWSK
jgi:hypothetical protein